MRTGDFLKLCGDGRLTFEVKNKMYGDTVEETGLLGATIELIGCVGRLRKLVLDQGGIPATVEDIEAIRNVLEDAHNYACIASYMVDTENWRGKYPTVDDLVAKLIEDKILLGFGNSEKASQDGPENNWGAW